MMTEEDWGGEAPLKVRAGREKNFLITYIYPRVLIEIMRKKNCESKVTLSDDSTGQ